MTRYFSGRQSGYWLIQLTFSDLRQIGMERRKCPCGVMKNPPFSCYFIALIALLFGCSENAMHCAFLLWAAAFAAGTYLLAARLCSRPFLAVCASLVTPVFLVSSTNVMCDTMTPAVVGMGDSSLGARSRNRELPIPVPRGSDNRLLRSDKILLHIAFSASPGIYNSAEAENRGGIAVFPDPGARSGRISMAHLELIRTRPPFRCNGLFLSRLGWTDTSLFSKVSIGLNFMV